MVITARKVTALRRYEERQKRGGTPADAAEDVQLDALLSREPTPEFAAQVAEECERLLGLLQSEELATIALAKMEGASNEEIATRLGCVPRTVERKLRRIRDLWESVTAP